MRKYSKAAGAAARMDDKGFYIILTICALAIVVSGYVLFFLPSGGDAATLEEPPSLPVTVPVTVPSADLREDEPMEPAAADTPEEPETPAASEGADPAEDSAAPEEAPPAEDAVATAAPAELKPAVWVRPVEGSVTTPFSGDELVFQPTFGDWRVHTGTDYAGDEGDRVYAVTDGTVERVWMDSLYGQCVELSHADGLHTIYKGLKEGPKAKEGSAVKAGDVIGSLGATNAAEDAQGAHLHLEARVGDTAVDVETFLTGTEGE